MPDRPPATTTGTDAGTGTARDLVAGARRVLVLTGAGISTDSGIPDFRGPDGVWTRDPGAERLATLGAYLSDPQVRRRAWQNRLGSPTWRAAPNAGHRALVDLEAQGRLHLLVTQNIDGLHQAAGTSADAVVEIHGTMRQVVCLRCGERTDAQPVLDRVAAGEADPSCQAEFGPARCGGILKSATISFGQSLVPEDLERAEAAARTCDLVLAVGSTLSVFPAAGIVPLAAASGAKVVIVNAEPTAFDDLADAVVRGSISQVLPSLVELDTAPAG
ncbi:MAG: SIR2 family NAD-dependent protein deacylase [Acidimicrobiales bacterium]